MHDEPNTRVRCSATTNEGKPCPLHADRQRDGTWYCHVHDPDGVCQRNLRDMRRIGRDECSQGKAVPEPSLPTDLETASVRELVTELEHRFDALMVLGFKYRGANQTDHLWQSWSGSATLCDGLVDSMKRTLDHVDRVEERRER